MIKALCWTNELGSRSLELNKQFEYLNLFYIGENGL